MHIAELHGLGEGQTVSELVVALARKTYYHVGGDAGSGDGAADQLHGAGELGGGVAAPHRGQYPVIAALQGNMEMGAQPLVLPQVQQLAGDFLRL